MSPGAQVPGKNPYHINHLSSPGWLFMLSAVKRYKLLVSTVLARCFPRTSAYVQSEKDLILRRWPDAAKKPGVMPTKASKKAKLPAKPPRPRETGTKTATRVATKPRTNARKPAGEGLSLIHI